MNRFYVTMTDKFMSGWGKADGKINKLVLECDSLEEAKIVEANAHRRYEMKHINIRYTRPSYPTRRYETSFHTKGEYDTWYKPNQFL